MIGIVSALPPTNRIGTRYYIFYKEWVSKKGIGEREHYILWSIQKIDLWTWKVVLKWSRTLFILSLLRFILAASLTSAQWLRYIHTSKYNILDILELWLSQLLRNSSFLSRWRRPRHHGSADRTSVNIKYKREQELVHCYIEGHPIHFVGRLLWAMAILP